jgi:hypothetical protein
MLELSNNNKLIQELICAFGWFYSHHSSWSVYAFVVLPRGNSMEHNRLMEPECSLGYSQGPNTLSLPSASSHSPRPPISLRYLPIYAQVFQVILSLLPPTKSRYAQQLCKIHIIDVEIN